MKKYIWIIFIVLFFISSCDKENSVTPITKIPPVVKTQPAVLPEKIKTYEVQNQEFDRVVGWISDESLLLIERKNDEFILFTYDLYSEEKTVITKVNEPIIDVKIHPSKDVLAIIMSDNSLHATIKIVTLGGKTIDQLTIESSELYIDWHTTNPTLLLITSFNKDWTFDTFAYSSLTQEMKRIPSIHPILKWKDENHLVAINWRPEDALSGGTISEMAILTSEVKDTEDSGYIYFDIYKDIFVGVKIDPTTEQFIYTLTNVITKEVKIYRTPALSNYSQWFVPELFWTEENSFLTYVATNSGLIDSLGGNLHLAEFNFESKEDKKANLSYSMLSCSPSGEYCLTGNRFEEILNLESGNTSKWLDIKE
ncbi:MAG: hypothetical protein ACE3JQ_08025 [Paenisporosarcina sp.]